jgi:aspartyl/asparaginyl-tRNA synthetase
MREDGDAGSLAFDNMQQRQVKGTHDWTEYSITLPLRPEAKQLAFGVLVAGTGKVWVDDLQLLVICRAVGSEFIAVEGYPMSKRPFYTHPQPGDERWSNSFDLLFRGQELVTGGQRLHRHQDYLAAISARGEDPAAYADYLEAFAHGMPPHGGFAIGLERWAGRLTQAENIREVTLFPRDLHRLTP